MIGLTLTSLCFLAGVARYKFRPAPLIAGGAVVLAFGAFLIVVGVWAGACWECESKGEPFIGYSEVYRTEWFNWAVMIGLGLTMGMLALIWIGTRLAVLLRLLLRTNGSNTHAWH